MSMGFVFMVSGWTKLVSVRVVAEIFKFIYFFLSFIAEAVIQPCRDVLWSCSGSCMSVFVRPGVRFEMLLLFR